MRMLHPVTSGPLSDDALDRAYPWPESAPWLRVNMVSTVDGAARSPDGLSHGISSDADRHLFGLLRGRADVVLAGASTVREEGYRPARPNPDFAAAREDAGRPPAPVIALVSRSLSLDLTSPLFTEADPRTIVLTCAAADPVTRARVGEVADVAVCGDTDVDLREAVSALHARGLHRIQCEGGPHVLSELVAADVVDELLLTVSPLLAGGAYADRTDITRILAGRPLPAAPLTIRLAHVLEDGGTLFLRYLLRAADRSSSGQGSTA